MRKLILGLLLAVLLAPLSFSADSVRAANFAFRYNVSSATLTYVRMTGQNGDPFGGPIPGTGTVKTSSSSTTVTENVSGTNPFRDIGVNDVIIVNRTSNALTVRDIVVVTAKASDASITVDPAVDWSAGFIWTFFKAAVGTTVNDGWISVSGARSVSMSVFYDQGDLDGLRVRWECKPPGLGAAPVIVYPGKSSDCGLGGTLSVDRCNFATAGANSRLTIQIDNNTFSDCRMGLAFATTDTSDVGANLEQVTAIVSKLEIK